MSREQSQALGEWLREMIRCPHCARSYLVLYTAWRGHGTGRHGESYYTPTAREEVSPERHCICPGGPVWQELELTEFGQYFRLSESYKVWSRLGKNPQEVIIWYNTGFRKLTLEQWDQVLKLYYRSKTSEGSDCKP